MSAWEYVVPQVMRAGHFVRWQPGTRHVPMRVTAKAFEAAGLPVPADRRQWNIYRATGCKGEPWSPEIDHHVERFGAEYLPGRPQVCADCDQQLAVDNSVWLDGLRWLAEAGAANGHLLDVTQFAAVQTPGDPDRRHGPGWHLWAEADPDYPVRFGALRRCAAVEIKAKATCPGSPGYRPAYVPDQLPVLPRWIAELAGPPRPPVFIPAATGIAPERAMRRLKWAIADLLNTGGQQGERNRLLFKAACRAGEARCDPDVATAELMGIAAQVGLVAEDGEARCLATIRQGLMTGSQDRLAVSRG